MLTKLNLSLFASVIMLAGCVTTGANIVPNQKPQTFVKSTNLSRISSEIARLCDEGTLYIEKQTDRTVTCRGEAGTMANIFLGTSGGSGVTRNISFNLIPYREKNQTKITARAWFENQNAFGGLKQTGLENNKSVNDEVLKFLNEIKKRVE